MNFTVDDFLGAFSEDLSILYVRSPLSGNGSNQINISTNFNTPTKISASASCCSGTVNISDTSASLGSMDNIQVSEDDHLHLMIVRAIVIGSDDIRGLTYQLRTFSLEETDLYLYFDGSKLNIYYSNSSGLKTIVFI